MKKTLFLAFALLCACVATAQTQFRPLSYEQAIAVGKAEGKPVFIDFYTSWCGPCKMMARDLFPQPKAGEFFNNTFVTIQLDAEKEGKDAATKFKVTAYPTFKVIDPATETEIFSYVGANTDVDAFIAEIKAGMNPDLTPEKVAQRYAEGDRTPEIVSAHAANLIKQGSGLRNEDPAKLKEAVSVVDQYFGSLTDQQRLASENLFIYGWNYTSSVADPKARFLIGNRNRFAPADTASVRQTISKLLLYRTGTLLQGMDKVEPQEVTQLAADVKLTGLDSGEEKNYAATWQILNAQATGNETKYIEALEKNFTDLNESSKAGVIAGIASVVTSSDPTVIGRADKFIRSQLATLDPANIYYAAMTLMQFDKRLAK